jgi:hypothetical protein
MSPANQHATDTAEALAAQTRLRQQLADVDLRLAEHTQVLRQAVAEVDRLAGRLARHLAEATVESLLTQVTGRAPHLAHRADVLIARHQDLARRSAQLADLAAAAAAADGLLADKFHVLRRELLDHEQALNAVLQEALLQDVGTED